MDQFCQKNYNLVYLNCKSILDTTYKIINNFDRSKMIGNDLQKLITHFTILKLLELSSNKKFKEKPVFYFLKFDVDNLDNQYVTSFYKAYNKIKDMMPVPICIIPDIDIFIKNNGELRELNLINSSYYSNRKHSTKKLLKYFKNESFSELLEIFRHPKNIKTLSN